MNRRLQIETPEAVAFAYPLAGLGSRGLAALIDAMLLGLLIVAEIAVGALVVFLVGRVWGPVLDVFAPWAIALLVAAVFVTYWGYYIYGEVLRNGRTPGKRIMRIRVVREDGSRVGVLDSVVRNVVRILDLMPGTYGFGIAAVLLSARAQRLGDMAAGTVVIEEPQPLGESAIDPSGEKAALVRDYLARRAAFAPEARWQVGVALLAIWGESPGPGWQEPHVAGRLADLVGARDSVA